MCTRKGKIYGTHNLIKDGHTQIIGSNACFSVCTTLRIFASGTRQKRNSLDKLYSSYSYL